MIVDSFEEESYGFIFAGKSQISSSVPNPAAIEDEIVVTFRYKTATIVTVRLNDDVACD